MSLNDQQSPDPQRSITLGQMDAEDAGRGAPSESSIPDHIMNPQRLPMSHELFTEGNFARELLAKQTLQSAPDREENSTAEKRRTSHSRAGARCCTHFLYRPLPLWPFKGCSFGGHIIVMCFLGRPFCMLASCGVSVAWLLTKDSMQAFGLADFPVHDVPTPAAKCAPAGHPHPGGARLLLCCSSRSAHEGALAAPCSRAST